MKFEILATKKTYAYHVVDAPSEEEARKLFLRIDLAGNVKWDEEVEADTDTAIEPIGA